MRPDVTARITTAGGDTRILHPTEVLRLIVEHDHADTEHVRVETHVGRTFTH